MVLPQFLLPNLLPGCTQGKPNGMEKKKIGNCGNAIAEIGGINFLQLWQQHCQKWGKKKKGYEICERVKKKSCHVYNIFTTFSQ